MSAAGKEADILHLQRLQSLLDQPIGYGVRIQYLGIAMSIEDQLSWASENDNQTARALTAHTRELVALRASIDQLSAGQKVVLRTMMQFAPSLPTPDLISVSSFTRNDNFTPTSADLDPAMVLLFHRLACFDLPTRAVGRLRTSEVWLGDMKGQRAEHVQPPPAGELEQKLNRLCQEWRADFPRLQNHDEKLKAVAKFHARFLVLHPFFDGNGRAARAILMQQCLDLFGIADMTLMNKGADYYAALKSADAENFDLLINLIRPIVTL